jgi:hypothetical protein
LKEEMLAQDRMDPSRTPRTRRDLVLQEVGEEGLVYDRDGALVHILNLTALFAWKLCDGTRSTVEIVEAVRAAFSGTAARDVQRDIEALLERLEERGLLERRP